LRYFKQAAIKTGNGYIFSIVVGMRIGKSAAFNENKIIG
jgi:hypothetical protein